MDVLLFVLLKMYSSGDTIFAYPPHLFAQEDHLGILAIDAAALRRRLPARPVAQSPLAAGSGCGAWPVRYAHLALRKKTDLTNPDPFNFVDFIYPTPF